MTIRKKLKRVVPRREQPAGLGSVCGLSGKVAHEKPFLPGSLTRERECSRAGKLRGSLSARRINGALCNMRELLVGFLFLVQRVLQQIGRIFIA